MTAQPMKTRIVLAGISLAVVLGAMHVSGGVQAEGGESMSETARGTFEVTVEPAVQEEFSGGGSLGRFTLDKRYHGDLEATAKGEMLTAGTAVEGSAAYVAIERVEGALGGRQGAFMLQHLGSMARGEQRLTITVVPDSGTGDLVGLEGELGIRIEEDGGHFYELDYTIADGP